ncbi:MAG: hypothetical protein ACHRXM_04840 [Isosphaerales bacterium]
MKQAQSETSRYRSAGRWWFRDPVASHSRRRTDKPFDPGAPTIKQPNSWLWGEMLVTLIAALWFVVSLPFRLVFWTIAWLGRLTAVVLGFTLMVVGMALWAGPLFFVGIPLFLVGLVLTLRCLD